MAFKYEAVLGVQCHGCEGWGTAGEGSKNSTRSIHDCMEESHTQLSVHYLWSVTTYNNYFGSTEVNFGRVAVFPGIGSCK